MEKLLVFIFISAGITLYSLPSLRSTRSHGFYRYFAFEALLGLVLVNSDLWFANPFSIHQIISWVLLLASAALAVHGFFLLRSIGKPQGSFENTTALVVKGAYRFIRHPLYASLLLLGWGAALKHFTWLSLVLVHIIMLALVLTARMEEAENRAHFGESYVEYSRRTKMFIPFIY